MAIFEGLISIWQNFVSTMATFVCYSASFHCCTQWPNIEQIIWPSGHTDFQLPCYQLNSKADSRPQDHWTLLSGLFDVVRPCTWKELQLFRPKGKWISGHYFHTNMIDSDVFIPYMADLFKDHGGVIEQGRVDDLSRLKQRYPDRE